VLIGADGLKSAVRRSLLGEKAKRAQSWSEVADITASIEPTWSGTIAYRALIPADRLKSRQPNHRALTQPMQVKRLFMLTLDAVSISYVWQYLGKNAVRHLHLHYADSLSDFKFRFQYIIAYPISRGTIVNFAAFRLQQNLENTKHDGPWVSFCEKSEFMNIFRGWEPEVQTLLDVGQNIMNDSKKYSHPLSV
jgi:salicylate hydroxylase